MPSLDEVEHPPTHWFINQRGPGHYETRRLTDADIERIRREYPDYSRACEEAADAMAERGEYPSRAVWEKRPARVRIPECYKGCYKAAWLRKGSVYEFAAWGVYVCECCDYAWPPDPEGEAP